MRNQREQVAIRCQSGVLRSRLLCVFLLAMRWPCLVGGLIGEALGVFVAVLLRETTVLRKGQGGVRVSERHVTIRDLRYRYAGASEDVPRIPALERLRSWSCSPAPCRNPARAACGCSAASGGTSSRPPATTFCGSDKARGVSFWRSTTQDRRHVLLRRPP